MAQRREGPKKRGRKPKDPALVSRHCIGIRLNDADYAQFRRAMHATGVTSHTDALQDAIDLWIESVERGNFR